LNIEPIPLSGIDVPSLIGAAMMIRRSLLEALSGFDERFFFFLEETDLCLRAKQPSAISGQRSADSDQQTAISRQPSAITDQPPTSNLQPPTSSSPPHDAGGLFNVEHRTLNVEHGFCPSRVVLLPGARIVHLQGKTVGKNWIKGRIEYNISLYKFIKKHHSPLYYRTFQAARFLKSSTMIIVLSLLPFLLIGKSIRKRYVYYWKIFLWHLAACPPTAGLKDLAPS
jgi:GT2 family glycosyltransferase